MKRKDYKAVAKTRQYEINKLKKALRAEKAVRQEVTKDFYAIIDDLKKEIVNLKKKLEKKWYQFRLVE